MENRILEVFYGADGKPYKDQERSVLFPVVGNEYQGANDFTHIRFYYQRLCGEDNTLVAVFKNAKGELGCKPLSTSTDSAMGEKYALLPISDFLTQYKGDIYIALQCYSGDADAITWDSDNNMWVLNTQVPTIRSTANIKMSVNYAPLIVGGGEEDLLTLQVLLSYIAEKSNIDDVVIVVDDISTEDLSGYDVGQLFYDNDTHTYYQKTDTSPYYTKALGGMGVLGAPNIICRSDESTRTIEQLHTIYGDSAYIVLRYLDKDYLYFSKKVGSTYICVAFDTEEQRFYKDSGVSGSALPSTILIPANKIEIASKVWVQNLLNNDYVPYSGAIKNVDLNSKRIHNIETDYANNTQGYKAEEKDASNVKFVLDNSMELRDGYIDEYMYAYARRPNATIFNSGSVYKKVLETGNIIYFFSPMVNIYNAQGGGTTLSLGRLITIDRTYIGGSWTPYYTERSVSLDLFSKTQANNDFAKNISLELDGTTYTLVAKLKNDSGSVIATSNAIDLPLESIVSSATYYDTYTYDGTTYTKVIVITLATTSVPTIVPVGDLVSGLEKEACVEIPVSPTSGTFTSAQMELLALDNASIKIGGYTYLHKVLANQFIAKSSFVSADGYKTESEYKVVVQNNGNYTLTSTTIEFYDKSQVDTKVTDIQNDMAKMKKDIDYALKYPLIYGTPTTDTDEDIGLTTAQLPATTLPKGLINYVGGMSFAVNQLISNNSFATTDGWAGDGTTLSVSDGIMTAQIEPGSSYPGIHTSVRAEQNHKYLVSLDFKGGTSLALNWAGVNDSLENNINPSVFTKINAIVTTTTSGEARFALFENNGTGAHQYKEPTVTDLTKMFGAGNEPTTASDPRIVWLLGYLDERPQYDEGSIVNAPVTSIISKGFNIWDEEWEVGEVNGTTGAKANTGSYIRSKNFIDAQPSTTYYAKSTETITIYQYDGDGDYIGAIYGKTNDTFTTASNCRKLLIATASGGTTYNHDICINLSGTMNGTYLPYVTPTSYPIPAEVQALDGYGLGLSDTLYNYIDFENKKFVKSLIELDLGDLNYSYSSSSELFQVSLSQIKASTSNLLCSKYTYGVLSGGGNDPDKTIYVYQKTLFISDSAYTDATTFKNAIVGQKLVIELETPTETDISEYIDRDFPNENLIDIYQGGEVEFENEDDMAVPYSLTYQYKVE